MYVGGLVVEEWSLLNIKICGRFGFLFIFGISFYSNKRVFIELVRTYSEVLVGGVVN